MFQSSGDAYLPVRRTRGRILTNQIARLQNDPGKAQPWILRALPPYQRLFCLSETSVVQLVTGGYILQGCFLFNPDAKRWNKVLRGRRIYKRIPVMGVIQLAVVRMIQATTSNPCLVRQRNKLS